MSHVLVLEARFYADLAEQLLKGALPELYAQHITHERISVPGCFELPAALAMGVASRKYDGFVVLGCVIRGETSHYDVVCAETARGLNHIAIAEKIALGFGVITAENFDQAAVRADVHGKNMGGKAAKACIQMMQHHQKFGLVR